LLFRIQKRTVASVVFRKPKQEAVVARIEPLTPPYEPDVADALDRMGPPIGLFRMMVRNVPMASAMQVWGRYELGRTLSLSLREREIVIVRTCARAGCEYEWGVHVAHYPDVRRRTFVDQPATA
jgi:alkylhydroperoxidase family enzyme